MTELPRRRKLIEVALPLEAINAAAAREKAIRPGHPSTLHLWWARRPLAVARSVLLAQFIDDPSSHPDLFPTIEAQAAERERLFTLISKLAPWEASSDQALLDAAHQEIRQSWEATCRAERRVASVGEDLFLATWFDPDRLPAFHDPFAGGGSLPLEALRLGLETSASDLNPVAVLINHALLTIPSRFAYQPSVARLHERSEGEQQPELASPTAGIVEDVRRYGTRLRTELERRLGHLYPTVTITPELVKKRPDLAPYAGESLKIVSWLWARTVASPDPRYSHLHVPLVTSFDLSTRPNRRAYIEPVVHQKRPTPAGEVRTAMLPGFEYWEASYEFEVRLGEPPDAAATARGTRTDRPGQFRCLVSGATINRAYLQQEFRAGRQQQRLMAIVLQAPRHRIYLSPSAAPPHPVAVHPPWKLDQRMNTSTHDLVSGRGYGIERWSDLYTDRQAILLATLCDLIEPIRDEIHSHAIQAGLVDDRVSLAAGGRGALAYADAVVTYLALAIGKTADAQSMLCRWKPSMDQSIATFARQALPMVWDFSESNPFGKMAGDFQVSLDNMMRAVERLPIGHVNVSACDARSQMLSDQRVVSTDPPYYDNIGYADLSDFFYLWIRRALQAISPSWVQESETPKEAELVALAYRHGGVVEAKRFFAKGISQALNMIARQHHPDFPLTLYYASKRVEAKGATGADSWQSFLEAIISAGLAITATWPLRTELSNRVIGRRAAMLASSLVLVCRPQPLRRPSGDQDTFVQNLSEELARVVPMWRQAGVAAVDLPQAAVGLGMSIYTRYVWNQQENQFSVSQAMSRIAQTLQQFLAADSGENRAATGPST